MSYVSKTTILTINILVKGNLIYNKLYIFKKLRSGHLRFFSAQFGNRQNKPIWDTLHNGKY